MTTFYFRIVHAGALLRGSEHSFDDISDPALSDYVDRLAEQVGRLGDEHGIEIQIFDLNNPTTRYTIEGAKS